MTKISRLTVVLLLIKSKVNNQVTGMCTEVFLLLLQKEDEVGGILPIHIHRPTLKKLQYTRAYNICVYKRIVYKSSLQLYFYKNFVHISSCKTGDDRLLKPDVFCYDY